MLSFKLSERCRFDVVSLGEVMLRFDPGENRVRCARQFTVWEGGGEYNVARGLRRCFGMRSGLVTAIANNEVGHLLEDLLLQGGVDLTYICWKTADGIGAECRVGLNFTERGFGIRPPLGVSDRARSAASQLQFTDTDWASLLQKDGVRVLHTGGIFGGLTETSYATAMSAMQAARAAQTIVSFDFNFRPSLFQNRGGYETALKINHALIDQADILFAAPQDLTAMVKPKSELSLEALCQETARQFPRLKVISCSIRKEVSANLHLLSGFMWSEGEFVQSERSLEVPVLDRIGGGDAFAAGVLYGYLNNKSFRETLAIGVAHGALALSTPGDTSQVIKSEVDALVSGTGFVIKR